MNPVEGRYLTIGKSAGDHNSSHAGPFLKLTVDPSHSWLSAELSGRATFDAWGFTFSDDVNVDLEGLSFRATVVATVPCGWPGNAPLRATLRADFRCGGFVHGGLRGLGRGLDVHHVAGARRPAPGPV